MTYIINSLCILNYQLLFPCLNLAFFESLFLQNWIFVNLLKFLSLRFFSFSKYAFLFIYNLSEVNKKILVVHFIKCCVLGLKDVPKCSYDNGRGTKKFSLLYFSEYLENVDFQLFFWIM